MTRNNQEIESLDAYFELSNQQIFTNNRASRLTNHAQNRAGMASLDGGNTQE